MAKNKKKKDNDINTCVKIWGKWEDEPCEFLGKKYPGEGTESAKALRQ